MAIRSPVQIRLPALELFRMQAVHGLQLQLALLNLACRYAMFRLAVYRLQVGQLLKWCLFHATMATRSLVPA